MLMCNRESSWTSCIPLRLLPLSRFYHFPAPTFGANERTNERTIGRSCPDVRKSAFPCREPVFYCALATLFCA